MSWIGYWEYDGNEIINATRVEQYAANLGLGWFRPVYNNDALPYMLGDGLRYHSPFMDDAPWTDPDIGASYAFIGLYPLNITGVDDSSRSSSPVESMGEGGVPGRLRHGLKTLVFSCLLLATTEAGASYGIKWLKQALMGNPCGPSDVAGACNGAQLCYLDSPPDMILPGELGEKDSPDTDEAGLYRVDDPEECLTPYLRSLRRVLFNDGPTVTAKRHTTDGSAVWSVQFTAVAAPHEFGAEVPVLNGLMDDYEDNFDDDSAYWAGEYRGSLDLEGYIATEADCAVPEYAPIYDPECPAVVPPPEPPAVALDCWKPPKNWRRRSIVIPRQYVPLWGEVVPKVEVHAKKADLRSLRLRFYADVYGTGDASGDDCEFCGDIVVSYVPRDHTMVLDGAEQTVYIEIPGGGRQRADSLVFKTDGTPFEWPALSCGFGYVMTLDMPQTQVPPSVDLSLFARAV